MASMNATTAEEIENALRHHLRAEKVKASTDPMLVAAEHVLQKISDAHPSVRQELVLLVKALGSLGNLTGLKLAASTVGVIARVINLVAISTLVGFHIVDTERVAVFYNNDALIEIVRMWCAANKVNLEGPLSTGDNNTGDGPRIELVIAVLIQNRSISPHVVQILQHAIICLIHACAALPGGQAGLQEAEWVPLATVIQTSAETLRFSLDTLSRSMDVLDTMINQKRVMITPAGRAAIVKAAARYAMVATKISIVYRLVGKRQTMLVSQLGPVLGFTGHGYWDVSVPITLHTLMSLMLTTQQTNVYHTVVLAAAWAGIKHDDAEAVLLRWLLPSHVVELVSLGEGLLCYAAIPAMQEGYVYTVEQKAEAIRIVMECGVGDTLTQLRSEFTEQLGPPGPVITELT
jgi:hypothetical protein